MSKILLIGGTGYIGKFMVEASVKAGHPTFLLIREATLSNPAKSSIINKFKDLSVNLVPVRNILFLCWLLTFYIIMFNSYLEYRERLSTFRISP